MEDMVLVEDFNACTCGEQPILYSTNEVMDADIAAEEVGI